MTRKKNITVVASSLALGALLATGVSGVAMAANGDSSSNSSNSSSNATQQGKHGSRDSAGALSARDEKGGMSMGRGGKHGGIGRGHALHSTATVKDSTGAYVNLASIEGAITAVSATSMTVKAEDGFTATYVINADTKVHTDAKKDGTIADVAVGQNAEVRGTSSGTTLTADHVHAQAVASSASSN